MKKNCLYTINPWNRNVFDWGGLTDTSVSLTIPKTNINTHYGYQTPAEYLNSTNIFGISKAENPFSKFNISGGIKQMANTGLGAGILTGLSSIASTGAQNLISNGYNSGVGNAVGSIGRTVGAGLTKVNPLLGAAVNIGSGILAGGINAIGGTKVDEKALAQANNAINTLNSYKSNAKYYDDIQDIGVFGGIRNPYSGGLARKGWAEDKNQELKNSYANALSFAERSRENNAHNIFGDMLSDYAANYTALGGPLAQPYTGALGLMQQNRYIDAIDRRTDALAKNNNTTGTFGATANRFDAGGGFVSNFMEDPISAAMQYIQERDAEDAAAEAQAEAAAQQAAYDDMQQRLAAAETQNQGLQAMIESQGLDIKNMMEAQRQNNYAEGWQERMFPAPNDNAMMAKLRRSLADRGVSKRAHQDAIIANIMVESGGNPNARNSKSSARGMLQWLTPRYPKAWDYESQMDHIANTYNQYGGDNWLDRKALDEFMNTNDSTRAAQLFRQYYERPEAHTYKWTDKYINQMYRDNKAFGGELGTNGTDFTNGLLEINAGGSHEDNAYGGVLMGYDYEGVPNFVEEGETVFNDYVYSNRLTVPDFMHKELGLGGSKKALTFADASKILAKESVERPNNPIDQAGLMASLGKLAQIQETERARIQAEDMNTEMEEPMGLMAAYGGNLFAGGGEKEALDWVNRKFPNAKNKQAIARAIWRKASNNKDFYYRPRIDVFGKSSPDPQWNFDSVYSSMIPTLARNREKAFNDWVDGGFTPEEAFSMINEGKVPNNADLRSTQKAEFDRYVANRKAAKPVQTTDRPLMLQQQSYQGPQPQTQYSNDGTPKWGVTYGTSPSGLHMRVVNGRPEYRAKDGKYYKSEQNALAINAGKKLTTREKAAEAAALKASQRESLQRNEAQVQETPATTQRATATTPRATTAQQSAPSRAAGNAGTRSVRNAQAAIPQNSSDGRRRGDIVDYKYDWYRNGDDGTGRHWGFTPNENGIIDKNTGYTDEYRNLVSILGANDIRKWAADQGWKPGMTDFKDIKDPSLKSFLQNNGSAALENLKDEDWQKGALDDKYGFMHHVAAEIGANPQDLPTAEEYNRAIGESGDYVNNNNPFRIVGISRIGQQTPSMEWGRDEYGNRLRLITPAESTDTPTATTDNSPSGIRGEVAGGGRPTYATWMRYAPIFGTGMMALSDALGLTNKPDYTYANKLEAAANRAGIAPNIEAPAIGDYMRYDPFDRLFYANQLQANARATDRSIENNAGMNRGTALAAQIANGYNTNQNLGNLDRQGDEYNRGQYERKKEYDRRTNLINAQMQLEADMANARFAQQASSANLSGLAQAAAMRDAIDQRVGAARSANITNFLNNMGNLGRENFAFNQINWDRSRRYGARKNGVSYYWPSNNITAFGGEIEKMKRNKKNKR